MTLFFGKTYTNDNPLSFTKLKPLILKYNFWWPEYLFWWQKMKTWVQAGPKIFFWKLNSAVALFIFLKFLVWKFWKLFGSNASSFQFVLGELGPTNPKRIRELFRTYSYELHSLLLLDQNVIKLAILFVKEKRFVKWPKPQICKLIETKKNWVPTCMKVILKGTLIS